jgi:hypothetical protein
VLGALPGVLLLVWGAVAIWMGSGDWGLVFALAGRARACISLAFSFRDEICLAPRNSRSAGASLGAVEGCCLVCESRQEDWGPLRNDAAVETLPEKLATQFDEECR